MSSDTNNTPLVIAGGGGGAEGRFVVQGLLQVKWSVWIIQSGWGKWIRWSRIRGGGGGGIFQMDLATQMWVGDPYQSGLDWWFSSDLKDGGFGGGGAIMLQ